MWASACKRVVLAMRGNCQSHPTCVKALECVSDKIATANGTSGLMVCSDLLGSGETVESMKSIGAFLRHCRVLFWHVRCRVAEFKATRQSHSTTVLLASTGWHKQVRDHDFLRDEHHRICEACWQPCHAHCCIWRFEHIWISRSHASRRADHGSLQCRGCRLAHARLDSWPCYRDDRWPWCAHPCGDHFPVCAATWIARSVSSPGHIHQHHWRVLGGFLCRVHWHQRT